MAKKSYTQNATSKRQGGAETAELSYRKIMESPNLGAIRDEVKAIGARYELTLSDGDVFEILKLSSESRFGNNGNNRGLAVYPAKLLRPAEEFIHSLISGVIGVEGPQKVQREGFASSIAEIRRQAEEFELKLQNYAANRWSIDLVNDEDLRRPRLLAMWEEMERRVEPNLNPDDGYVKVHRTSVRSR